MQAHPATQRRSGAVKKRRSSRPGLQGGRDDAEKLLATRPGRCLNGQPKVNGLYKTRQRVGVAAGRKIALGDGTLQARAQISVALRPLLHEFFLKRIGRPPARKCTVHPKAGSW